MLTSCASHAKANETHPQSTTSNTSGSTRARNSGPSSPWAGGKPKTLTCEAVAPQSLVDQLYGTSASLYAPDSEVASGSSYCRYDGTNLVLVVSIQIWTGPQSESTQQIFDDWTMRTQEVSGIGDWAYALGSGQLIVRSHGTVVAIFQGDENAPLSRAITVAREVLAKANRA